MKHLSATTMVLFALLLSFGARGTVHIVSNLPNGDKDILLSVYSDDDRCYSPLKSHSQDFFLSKRLSTSKTSRLFLVKAANYHKFILNRSKVLSPFVSHESTLSAANKVVDVSYEADKFMSKTCTDSAVFFYINPMSAESTDKFAVEDLIDPTMLFNYRLDQEMVMIGPEESNYNILKPSGFKRTEVFNVLEEDDLSFQLNLLDPYNFTLSRKRGRWILQYLIKNGIDAKRLTVNAYGETQLISPENEAFNRRAELRIYQ